MERKTLSICILTYNREKLLIELLYSILKNNPPRSVEIIISDNDSLDNTELVVKEFIHNYSSIIDIKYFRNEKNYGIDGNTIRSIERATGKYTWLFSDDDIMPEGVIDYVLKSVQVHDYNLVYITHYSFKDGMDYKKVYKTFYPRNDFKLHSGCELFKIGGFGFISGDIFRTDLAKEKLKKIKGIYNNSHIEIALHIAFTTKGDYLFIGKKSVAARMPSKWNRVSFCKDAYIHTIDVYESLVVQNILPETFLRKLRIKFIYWDIFRFLINASINKDFENIKTLKRELSNKFPYIRHKFILNIYFIICSNVFFINLFKPVYYYVVSKRNS